MPSEVVSATGRTRQCRSRSECGWQAWPAPMTTYSPMARDSRLKPLLGDRLGFRLIAPAYP